jgi:hypothetical protein
MSFLGCYWGYNIGRNNIIFFEVKSMFTYTMFELIKLKMIAENIAIPLITALVGDLILVEIVMRNCQENPVRLRWGMNWQNSLKNKYAGTQRN